MSADIVAKLRRDAQAQRDRAPEGATVWIADSFEEAAGEIERLRLAIRRLAEQDATLSLLCKRDGSQVVTVTMDGTLTDEEMDDLRAWLLDCLRRVSTLTEGGNVALAERWKERAKRAAAMIERLSGVPEKSIREECHK